MHLMFLGGNDCAAFKRCSDECLYINGFDSMAINHAGIDAMPLVKFFSSLTRLPAKQSTGDERDIIAISLTRSNNHGDIGFLSDIRRRRETSSVDDVPEANLAMSASQEDSLALGELRRHLARLPADQRAAILAAIAADPAAGNVAARETLPVVGLPANVGDETPVRNRMGLYALRLGGK